MLATLEHTEGWVTLNGDYIPDSYVVRLYIFREGEGNGYWRDPIVKSFGNGVRAEDWILDEFSMPKSLLFLKYAK